MPNNLDLSALIRCLEVMADENSWDVDKDTYMNTLINPIEARPWQICAAALELVKAIQGVRYLAISGKTILDFPQLFPPDDPPFPPYGHDRISNQELPPHEI